MATKAPKNYVPVAEKIAALEAEKVTLTAEMNSAPEDQKAGLQSRIAEADRKICWYQGRANSPAFQQKERDVLARNASAPVAEAPVEGSTEDPSPAALVNES